MGPQQVSAAMQLKQSGASMFSYCREIFRPPALLLSLCLAISFSCSKAREDSSGLGRMTLPHGGEQNQGEQRGGADGFVASQEAFGDSLDARSHKAEGGADSILRRSVESAASDGVSCDKEGGCSVAPGCFLDQNIESLEVVFHKEDAARGWNYTLPLGAAAQDHEQQGEVLELGLDELVLGLDDGAGVAVTFDAAAPLRAQVQGFQGRKVGDIKSLNLWWVLKPAPQMQQPEKSSSGETQASTEVASSGDEQPVPKVGVQPRSREEERSSLQVSQHRLSSPLFKEVSLLVNGEKLYSAPWEVFQEESQVQEGAGLSPGKEQLYRLHHAHTLDVEGLRELLALTPEGQLGVAEHQKIRQHADGFYFERYLYEHACGRGYAYLEDLAAAGKDSAAAKTLENTHAQRAH